MAFTNVPLQFGGQAPLVALFVGVVSIVLLLVVLALPAFVGLIVSAVLIGVVSPAIPFSQTVARVTEAFGNNMTGIGTGILMAALTGSR